MCNRGYLPLWGSEAVAAAWDVVAAAVEVVAAAVETVAAAWETVAAARELSTPADGASAMGPSSAMLPGAEA